MSERLPKRVLIVGVSTRAAAESAARAGFGVTAIDAFCDLDQHPGVQARIPPGGYSVQSAARIASDIDSDALVYASGLENHPEEVEALASGRELWGNGPAVLRSVRDPAQMTRMFRDRGYPVPEVWMAGAGRPLPGSRRAGSRGPADGRQWLVKPLSAGGGNGVRRWLRGASVPPRSYLQEFIDGTPGSIVFVSARGHAVTLGVSEQLTGEPAFGATGFQYCGSILRLGSPTHRVDGGSGVHARLCDAASGLASAAAQEFGLVGVNGIDFVARGSVPYPVEVNPRWCASMELVEEAWRVSVFAAHARAVTEGALPRINAACVSRSNLSEALGKAVLFARQDFTAGDTRLWLGASENRQEAIFRSIRDVPRPGQRIRAGRPVCTIFARGSDPGACHAALVTRAEEVYRRIALWQSAV